MVRLTDIDRWGLYPAPDEASTDVDQHRDRDRQAGSAVNKRSPRFGHRFGHQQPTRNHPPSDSLHTSRFRSTRENPRVDTDDEPLPASRERFAPVQKQHESAPQSAGHAQWSLIDADDDIYELTEIPHLSNVTILPGDTAANEQLSDVQHPTSDRDHYFRGPASDIDFTTPSPVQTPILNPASDVDFTTPSPIQTPILNPAFDVAFTTPSPIQSPILNPAGCLGKRTASSNELVANKRRLRVTQQAQKILSSPLTDNLDAKPYSLMSARHDDFLDYGTRARQSSIAPFLSTRISGRPDSATTMPDKEQSQDTQTSKNTRDDSGILNFDLDMPYNFLGTSQESIDPGLITTSPTLEEQEASAQKSRMLREKALGRASNLNVAMSTYDSITPESHPDQPPSDAHESTTQASSPGIGGDTRHVEEEGHSENQVDRHLQESDATHNDETPVNDIRQPQKSNAPDNETLLNDIRHSQESHPTNNDAPLNEMRRPRPRPHGSHATNLEKHLNDIQRSHESNASDRGTHLKDIRRPRESHATNLEKHLNDIQRLHESNAVARGTHLKDIRRSHESNSTNLERPLNDIQPAHKSNNAAARETYLKDIRRPHESHATNGERPLNDIQRAHESNNAADPQTHLNNETHLNDIHCPQGSHPKNHDAPMNDIRRPPPPESHATNHDIRRPRPPERHATNHGPSLKDILQPRPHKGHALDHPAPLNDRAHESHATNHDIRRPQGSHPNNRDAPVNDVRRSESHATNNDAPLNNNQQHHRMSNTVDHGTHLNNIRRPHQSDVTERERPLNDIHSTSATGKANDIHPTTSTREASDVHTTISPNTPNVAPRPSGFEMLAVRRGNHFWSTNDHRGAAPAPVAVTHQDKANTPSKQKQPFGTRIPTQVADNLTEVLPNASPVKETEQRLNHRLPLMNRNGGGRQATRATDVPDRPARGITLGEHSPSQDRPREVGGSSIEIARDAVELTLPHRFDTWSEEGQQIIREHEIAKEANRDLEALFVAVGRIAQLRSFGFLKAIEEKELCSVQQFLDLVGRRRLSGKRQRPDISKISSRMRQRVTAAGGSLPTQNVVEQNIALLFPIEAIQDARNQMADLKAKIERLGAKRQNISKHRALPSIQVTANRDNRESEGSQNLDIPANIPVNASRHSRTPQLETLGTPLALTVPSPRSSPPAAAAPALPTPVAAPRIRGSQGFDQGLLDRMRKQSLAKQSQPEENQSGEEDEAASSSAETTTESDDDEADSDSDGETSGPSELFEYTVSSIYAGVEDYDSGDEYICLKTTDVKKANQKVDKLATEFEKKYPPEEGLRFGRRSNRSSWENGLVERYVSLGEDEVREARFFVKRQIASVARSAYRIARTRDPVISRIFYKVEWEKVTEYEEQQEQEEGEAQAEINWGPPERSTIPLHEILSFTTSAQANRHAADVWLAWYFRYFPGLEMEQQRRLDAEEIERELEMKADFGLFAKEDSFYSGQVPENDGDGGELQTPQRVRETFKIWVRKDHVYGPPN